MASNYEDIPFNILNSVAD